MILLSHLIIKTHQVDVSKLHLRSLHNVNHHQIWFTFLNFHKRESFGSTKMLGKSGKSEKNCHKINYQHIITITI